MDNSPKTDEQLVSLIKDGNIHVFGDLVGRYEKKFERYAKKFLSDQEDIKDVIQGIFIKIYVNINSFDTEKKFSSWAYSIAHNELVNALKKSKKKFLPLLDFDVIFPYNPQKKSNNISIDELDAKILTDEGLKKLDPKYREAIVLFYIEGLSYKEISDVMQVPVSTVGIRIKRAKEIIKSTIKKDE